ncbi:MAG: protein-export chaperone SecB [Proteobacteria bacterium]|nr:protein-export chaperone SecB [Pseudomonadota bacterium]
MTRTPKKQKTKAGATAAPATESAAVATAARSAPETADAPGSAKPPESGAQPVRPAQPAGATQPIRAAKPADQPLVVNAQYIKDLSFEAPAAPEIFQRMQTTRPDITINIDVQAVPLKDTAYEVILNMRAECKVEQKVAFIMELVYAGNFNIRVPREHLQAVLLVECPRLLFPFARSILAEISREGGFPPVLLGPVDFVTMYQKQMEMAGKAGGGAPPAEGGTPETGGGGPSPAS